MKKTILGKAIELILKVFKDKWPDFLVKLWRKIPAELKAKLVDIVEIVERIKQYVDSPVVDLITFSIPGDKDDKAVAWLRMILASITSELNLLDKKEYTATDYHNIATRLTQEITGMSYGQSAITIENTYQNYKV